MSPTCEDCGQTFETLTARRLHDCSSSTRGADDPDPELESLLEEYRDGDRDAVYPAVGTFEARLKSAHERGKDRRYRELSRRYSEPLVDILDDAVRSVGWSILNEFIDTYHPESSAELPHVTDHIQNVTGRYLIRTRVRKGVAAISTEAFAYFEGIYDTIDERNDIIREGLHPYGWGIGHPDHAVADRIHEYARTDLFIASAVLEHSFYADQYAAMDLLERIVQDDTIEQPFRHSNGEITDVRLLLDAPAGAASEFSPSIPRYWDWQAELDYEFELGEEIEERIRALARAHDLDTDLSEDWKVTELML